MWFKSHSVIHRTIKKGVKKLTPINYGKIISEHSGDQMHKSFDLALYIQEFILKNSARHKSDINKAIQCSSAYSEKLVVGGA